LQVLSYFVPAPILILAIVGLLRKSVPNGPELFVAVWLLGSFFLISSVGAEYSRAILPVLPPLALCAGLGLSKINALAQSLCRSHPNVRLKPLAPLLLVLVLVLSSQAAYQTISDVHAGYRQAGQLLAIAGQDVPVLANTQLVMGFYHPVNFGEINATNLSRNQYIVVDFKAAEDGYTPTIQRLTSEGQLRLVATIPADLPPEVYLDSMSFSQLAAWNYTYIQIYQITNATVTS
jgi:hypothetical protein